MTVTGFVGLFENSSFYFDGPNAYTVAAIIYGAFVITLSATLAARKCRETYSKTRFLLFLLMWMIVIQTLPSLLASIATFGIGVVIEYYWWFFPTIVGQTIMNYLITLPFWILAFSNTLYNQRLKSCLNLPNSSKS
jgi:uncharacterized membrane protein